MIIAVCGMAAGSAAPLNPQAMNPAQCKFAKAENGVLAFNVPEGKKSNSEQTRVTIPVDLAKLGASGKKLVISGEVKLDGVTKPAQPWNGVKVMLIYSRNGKMFYPSLLTGRNFGTEDWHTFQKAVAIPADVKNAKLTLGLQDSTGTVIFRNLDISVE